MRFIVKLREAPVPSVMHDVQVVDLASETKKQIADLIVNAMPPETDLPVMVTIEMAATLACCHQVEDNQAGGS